MYDLTILNMITIIESNKAKKNNILQYKYSNIHIVEVQQKLSG